MYVLCGVWEEAWVWKGSREAEISTCTVFAEEVSGLEDNDIL